jgi:hypothetical protein
MASIGGIQSNASVNAMSYSRPSSSLSVDQKNGIQSVLEKFDSKNLTASDAKKIVSEFNKLGVQPSKELATVMAASGFDAKQVGDLASGSAKRPPPPPAVDTSDNDVRDQLRALIASLNSNTDSNSSVGLTKDELKQFLQSASELLGSTGNLVDRTV